MTCPPLLYVHGELPFWTYQDIHKNQPVELSNTYGFRTMPEFYWRISCVCCICMKYRLRNKVPGRTAFTNPPHFSYEAPMSTSPSKQHSLSLQKKLLITLVIVALGFILAQLLVINFFVYPSYVALERNKGKTDIERCLNALGREIHYLDKFTHDWSSWDDSYEFIVDGNKDYIDSNLQTSTFVDNEIHLIFYVGARGSVVWGKAVDLESEGTVQIKDFPEKTWPLYHHLLASDDRIISGLFMSDCGPMLVASRPILHTDHTGPSHGRLIMGRLLNEDYIKVLQEQTQVKWTMTPMDQVSSELTSAEIELLQGSEKLKFRVQSDALIVYTIYNDLREKPALLLRAEISREISQQGLKTVSYAFMGSILGVFSIFTLLMVFLNRIIVRPVSILTRNVVTIRDSENLALLGRNESRDEIGVLHSEINHLIEKLFFYQQRLRGLSSQLLVSEETERRRFASELHDRIGQTLTIAKMRLDALGTTATSATDREEAVELSGLLGQLIQEARTLTFELSPPMLYEIGLCAALEWLVDVYKEQHELTVHLQCCEVPKDDNSTLAVMAFQIVRELLMNVVKHARTDEVDIEIVIRDDELLITVSDQGIGMAVDRSAELIGSSKKAFGLFSIRERLSNFGGSLVIDSKPGKGTTITFAIPFYDIELD